MFASGYVRAYATLAGPQKGMASAETVLFGKNMDWKQLITSIIGDLAWPIVVLVIAFGLRDHIAGLLPKQSLHGRSLW